MLMDDPGPAIFSADPDDEYRLTFSVPDLAWPGGRRPLMTMRCFEEDKMLGAIVWLGEHQQLWPAWRIVAEVHGGNALSADIAAMMEAEGIERFGSADYLYEACLGAFVTQAPNACDITLAVRLATRTLPIITYSFADARACDAVMAELLWGSGKPDVMELAALALLEGRHALVVELDAMMFGPQPAGVRTIH